MSTFKESSIGVFIRNQLTYTQKPAKKMYLYDIWKKYDVLRKQQGKKSIEYNNFLKYIWVLKTLGLIKETSAPRGYNYNPEESPLSGSVPKEWSKKYYMLNYPKEDINRRDEILNHPAWNNPFKYYRILIGSEKYFSSEEKKKEFQIEKLAEKLGISKQEAEINFNEIKKELHNQAELEKLKYASHRDTILIRIPKKLKEFIDRERKETSISAYLIEIFTQHGFKP